MRYLIKIEYFGANYSGWQRQKGSLSIQEVLEDKLTIFFGEPIKITASGRTDKGVHAMGQVAHFDTSVDRKERNIRLGINTLLPDDIRIIDCKKVKDDFHSQWDAVKKTYIYKMYISENLSPIRKSTHTHVLPYLDIDKMKDGAKYLLGEHDFDGFSSIHKGVKTTVRTVYKAEFTNVGDELLFEIQGNGFLYNMVRIIVGTLVAVGKGRKAPQVIEEMLLTKNRALGGKTFPPEGLYLKEVIYEKER